MDALTQPAGRRPHDPWTEGLRLEGVHAFGRCWRVCVADGVAVVEEMGEPAVAAVNRSAGS